MIHGTTVNNIIDTMMLDSGRIGKSFHHVWGMKDTIVCVMETAIPQLPDVTLIKSIATHTHTHKHTHPMGLY